MWMKTGVWVLVCVREMLASFLQFTQHYGSDKHFISLEYWGWSLWGHGKMVGCLFSSRKRFLFYSCPLTNISAHCYLSFSFIAAAICVFKGGGVIRKRVVSTCCLFDLTGRICLWGRQRKRKGQKKRGCLFSGNLRRNTSEHNSWLFDERAASWGKVGEGVISLLTCHLHQTVTHLSIPQTLPLIGGFQCLLLILLPQPQTHCTTISFHLLVLHYQHWTFFFFFNILDHTERHRKPPQWTPYFRIAHVDTLPVYQWNCQQVNVSFKNDTSENVCLFTYGGSAIWPSGLWSFVFMPGVNACTESCSDGITR